MILCMMPRNRNTLLTTFCFFSLICILICAGVFIASAMNGNALPPPSAIRFPSFLSRIKLFQCNFPAIVLSCSALILFVPFSTVLLSKFFGKNLPPEAVFFLGFLIGSLCECARLVTIGLGLWQTFSDLLLIFGRITIFGRTLVPASFLFAAIMSESVQRQTIARNFLILLSLSMIIAVVTPLNTSLITSTASIVPGFSNLFLVERIVFSILAFVSFLYNASARERIMYRSLAFAFLILILGYAILLCADSIFFCIVGYALFAVGIPKYLYIVHKLYVWG